MSKPNNPPAFPVSTGSDGGCLEYGMTLRDYFAAAALQGWLSSYDGDQAQSEVKIQPLAHFVYEIADAMLEERAK